MSKNLKFQNGLNYFETNLVPLGLVNKDTQRFTNNFKILHRNLVNYGKS